MNTTVRFNAKMISDLTAQQGGSESARRYFESMTMETQNEPRPGRVNTRRAVPYGSGYSYRTYAWADLEVVA